MKIRILGDRIIQSNKTYRGLYREEPRYMEEQELHVLWDWYASEAGDGGYIYDIEKAKKLVNTFARNSIRYEIIRIEMETITSNNIFLGIDICTKGGYSLLASGLEHSNENITEFDSKFELIKIYFQ